MVRLAPLALGLCATSASSTDELKFGDGVLQFAFDPVSLSLTNVTARHGSRTQGFILGEPRSLWQLNATNCSEVLPKGSQVDGQSTCTSCTHRLVTDATTRTLELLWYGVQGLPGGARVDVAVNISMTSAHPGRAHFSATVTKQPGSSLLCIQFLALPNLPSLVGARYSGSEWVFNPRAFGQTTEFVGAGAQQEEEDMNEAVAIRASGEGNWMPNGDNTMQWMAVWTKSSASGSGPPVGLYVGAHDPIGYLQLMIIRMGRYPNTTDPGEPAGVKWLHVNKNLLDSSGAVYTLPYPVVVESFAGDWWDGSQIYRSWALSEAAWTRAGPLSRRAKLSGANSVAQWLLDTPLWTQGGGPGPSAAAFAPQLAEHLELKDIGYFWCFWMKGKTGEDQAYPSPSYMPVNASLFNSSAETMHDAHVHAFPYINGRIAAPTSLAWTSGAAAPYACGRNAGVMGHNSKCNPTDLGGCTYFEEVYVSPFMVMDPATAYWQNTLSSVMANITALAPGVDGIYIDQVTGACALPCRGPPELTGHTAGGGPSWVEGNRQMFAKGKVAVGSSRAIVSESNADVYLSSVDGYLSLYGWNFCGAVPGFQSVYGGWALQIGAEWQSVITGDAINRGQIFSDDFPALLATQFVWGSVLGGDSFNEYYGALFFANSSNNALRIYTASLASHRLSWGRTHAPRLRVDYLVLDIVLCTLTVIVLLSAGFLIHGRLMRPPRLLNSSLPVGRLPLPVPNKTNPKLQGECPLPQPTMQLWHDPESKTLGLVAVNYSPDESVDFSVAIDVSVVATSKVVVVRNSTTTHPPPAGTEQDEWVEHAVGVRTDTGYEEVVVRTELRSLTALLLEIKAK